MACRNIASSGGVIVRHVFRETGVPSSDLRRWRGHDAIRLSRDPWPGAPCAVDHANRDGAVAANQEAAHARLVETSSGRVIGQIEASRSATTNILMGCIAFPAPPRDARFHLGVDQPPDLDAEVATVQGDVHLFGAVLHPAVLHGIGARGLRLQRGRPLRAFLDGCRTRAACLF